MGQKPKRLVDKDRLIAQILKRMEIATEASLRHAAKGDRNLQNEWAGRAVALAELSELVDSFTEEN